MPNANVSFAGQTLIVPGAYYADIVQPVSPVPATTPPLIFLGNGYGQKPQTAVTYSTPQALLTAIRGGPCSGFVPFLYNGSNQLFGAQQVTFINVSENTQSSLTLNSGASGMIDLKSVDYGLPSNLLQATVANGVVAGKTVTIYDGFLNVTAQATNLGVPFQLSYTGAASGVTYSVTTSGGVATQFSTSSPNPGESVSVNLSNYPTVSLLAQYLNGTGFYSAQVISQGDLPSNNLDSATTLALSSGFAGVFATLGDVIWFVNQHGQNLATAALHAGAVSSSASPLTNISATQFAGATSVPPVLSDYASGFNVALTQPGFVAFADSNAAGVISLGVQHAFTASQPVNGKFRRFITGSSTGDSIATTTANSRGCNAKEATYVYPGFYANSTFTGQKTLYSGLYAAAAVAGMIAGNPPATPLTNKSLAGIGVEVQLTTSQIDQLQQAGVMPLYVSAQTGVPTIVSDFTTWQNDANPENIFNQQIGCRHYLAYSVLNALQPYVGSIADPLSEAKILNAVKSVLNGLLYNSGSANGVLASWNPSSLILNYTGTNQVASVTVSVAFVGQNRFVTCTVDVSPLNITLAATVS